MRGFLAGSFALIVLYVAVQPGSAAAVSSGSNVLVRGLRRLMSADVAGLPAKGNWGAGGTGDGPLRPPQPTTPTPRPATTGLPANVPVWV